MRSLHNANTQRMHKRHETEVWINRAMISQRTALELHNWSSSTWISPSWERLGIDKISKSDRYPRPTQSHPRVVVASVSVRSNPWSRDAKRLRAIQHQQRQDNTTNNTTTNCHTLRWRTIQHQRRLIEQHHREQHQQQHQHELPTTLPHTDTTEHSWTTISGCGGMLETIRDRTRERVLHTLSDHLNTDNDTCTWGCRGWVTMQSDPNSMTTTGVVNQFIQPYVNKQVACAWRERWTNRNQDEGARKYRKVGVRHIVHMS